MESIFHPQLAGVERSYSITSNKQRAAMLFEAATISKCFFTPLFQPFFAFNFVSTQTRLVP
jgi:hypothetical protein